MGHKIAVAFHESIDDENWRLWSAQHWPTCHKWESFCSWWEYAEMAVGSCYFPNSACFWINSLLLCLAMLIMISFILSIDDENWRLWSAQHWPTCHKWESFCSWWEYAEMAVGSCYFPNSACFWINSLLLCLAMLIMISFILSTVDI